MLGHRTRTFTVEGHHYALVLVDDLEPASVTPYEVRLDGDPCWPPDDGRPRPGRPHPRRASGRCGWSSAPAASAAPSRATVARAVAGGAVASSASTRSGPTRSGCSAARPSGRTRCSCSATRSTPTRSRRQTLEFIRKPPRHRRAAGRAGGRLRGVHAPLPRVVVGPRHPLAALDRADRDDLRRPRRQRRLEHLAGAGSSEMRAEPWWEARITGAFMAYWIYQHLGNLSPPELAEEEMLELVKRDDDAGPRLRAVRAQCDRESAASRWAYYRDFGDSRLARASTRAPRACSPTAGARWSTRRSGTGSSTTRSRLVRPPRDREHAARCSCRTASTTSRRGTRRSATGAGATRSRRLARASAARGRPRALGRRSTSSFERLCDVAATGRRRGRRRAAAGDDRAPRRRRAQHLRRRASTSAPAIAAAASSRSSARRSGTRSGRASGASSG